MTNSKIETEYDNPRIIHDFAQFKKLYYIPKVNL
jgi:hypothetical protein